MNHHTPQLSQSSMRLLWGGLLAASILWLLALASNNGVYVAGDAGSKSVAASLEMPLHVPAEHSRALKRFFKRTSNPPSTDLSHHLAATETPVALWVLIASEFVVTPSLTAAFSVAESSSPRVYLQQLQSLDSPRAPPFV
ncbi:hypothetical protein [Cellvibrio sp. NN19]|uniref:hypothetical protein n=1 Tax=Cellvibrio chitinivorans TaxID=3102792 RepID=UPI002B40C416|nr:hypothetical protein [Cellvibrio sp. NN19]